jgi:hypothetical protein
MIGFGELFGGRRKITESKKEFRNTEGVRRWSDPSFRFDFSIDKSPEMSEDVFWDKARKALNLFFTNQLRGAGTSMTEGIYANFLKGGKLEKDIIISADTADICIEVSGNIHCFQHYGRTMTKEQGVKMEETLKGLNDIFEK